MKPLLQLMAALILVASLMGCASTGGYFVDRGRDLTDIVTVSVEMRTVGTSLQVGPLLAGASYGNGKGFGMRSGILGSYDFVEFTALLGGIKEFDGDDERPGKAYELESRLLAFPLEVVGMTVIMLPFNSLESQSSWSVAELWQDRPPIRIEDGNWQTFFQCEATASLFGGIRIGFNPAELLDFLLGWTTLDICGDDQYAMEKIEQSVRGDGIPPPQP